MQKKLTELLQKFIVISFYLLFFLVPLFLTPYNFELFEYNKMMLVYGFTVIIIGSWMIKMIVKKEIIFKGTPLDLPLLLFLLSQVISTFLSIDRHVSLFGYYSRFNGGLLSTIAYILLFYAFVTNFPKKKIKNLFTSILLSGVLVASYGFLQHFGIDKNLWVQDVQNRVFSTLGQPNWLAAYLAILIPITIGLMVDKLSIFNSQFSLNFQSLKIKNLDFISNFKFQISNYIGLPAYWTMGSMFYLTLLYTKSRSGFLGLWISMIILWLILFILHKLISLSSAINDNSNHLSPQAPPTHAIAGICGVGQKITGFFILIFLLITFLWGAPFQEVNRFALRELFFKSASPKVEISPEKPTGGSVIEIGVTESGTIRKIVWKGATDIFKNYPLFGSGVETFAYSYFKFRPVEHNMTSEWDFLYNKAHNEYLNFAATTGAFGLGSYLLFIGVFILWNFQQIKTQILNVKTTTQNSKLNSFKILDMDLRFEFLVLSLFIAWLTILITNFFGFSVVIIQLFFFLIPAISFILTTEDKDDAQISTNHSFNFLQKTLMVLLLFVICYMLFVLSRLWYADTLYAEGGSESKSQDYYKAYQTLKSAILINRNEPVYYDEFVVPAAYLATLAFEQKQATLSSELAREAQLASNQSLAISPNNINFWKTRTRMFYTLSDIDQKFLEDAAQSLEQARYLSPTDPKITYNLALLYDKMEKTDSAIALLEETTKLKTDYKDAYFALGLFYEREKKYDKAKEAYNFILTRINPNDEEAAKRLKELK